MSCAGRVIGATPRSRSASIVAAVKSIHFCINVANRSPTSVRVAPAAWPARSPLVRDEGLEEHADRGAATCHDGRWADAPPLLRAPHRPPRSPAPTASAERRPWTGNRSRTRAGTAPRPWPGRRRRCRRTDARPTAARLSPRSPAHGRHPTVASTGGRAGPLAVVTGVSLRCVEFFNTVDLVNTVLIGLHHDRVCRRCHRGGRDLGHQRAWHLQDRCPTKSYAILERRENIGGTWDLFQYPGIRSDSDMYTLGFRFRPWTERRPSPRASRSSTTSRSTAAMYGIDKRIRYGHKVVGADWSSADTRWTVRVNRAARKTRSPATSCSSAAATTTTTRATRRSSPVPRTSPAPSSTRSTGRRISTTGTSTSWSSVAAPPR